MKLFPIVVLVTGLGLCQVARADEEYDKLLKEYEEAEDAWYEQLQKAEEALEDKDAPLDMSSRLPPRGKFVERFQRYAKKHASKPEAIPALGWIIGAGANVSPGETQEESLAKAALVQAALDRLIEDHAAQPEVKDVLPDLRWASYRSYLHIAGKDRLVAFYEKVLEKNKNKEAVAGATFNLAYTLYQASQHGDEDQDDKTRRADKTRAVQLFRKFVRQYPDTEPAKEAEGYVFEIERLQIGMVAPDFAGRDVDGKEIKLSQFRGQVVVLNFWGFWCGPCREMLPHEREMVKRLADKPFTLLGIISDKSRSALKKALKDENITWSNIYDGLPDEGEIANHWNVHGAPVIFILDHTGTIRYRDLYDKRMEEAVVKLLGDIPEK